MDPGDSMGNRQKDARAWSDETLFTLQEKKNTLLKGLTFLPFKMEVISSAVCYTSTTSSKVHLVIFY